MCLCFCPKYLSTRNGDAGAEESLVVGRISYIDSICVVLFGMWIGR